MTPKRKDLRKALEEAFAFTEDVIKHPERYPDRFVVLRPETLRSIFSPQRARLVQYLKRSGPVGSVDALATALHRSVPAVSRDLHYLSGWTIVAVKTVGRRKEISAPNIPILLR